MELTIPTSPITIPLPRSTTPSPSPSICPSPPPKRERYDIESHIPTPPFVPSASYTPAFLPGYRPSPPSIPERLGRTSFYTELGFGEFAELLATEDHLNAPRAAPEEETVPFYNVVPERAGTPKRVGAGDGYQLHMNAPPNDSPCPPEVRVLKQKGIWARVRKALRRPVFLWGVVRKRKPRKVVGEVAREWEDSGGYLTPPNGARTPSVVSEDESTEGAKSLLVGDGEEGGAVVGAAQLDGSEDRDSAVSDRDAQEPTPNRLSTLSIKCTGDMCRLTDRKVICFQPGGVAKEPELSEVTIDPAADINDNLLALKDHTSPTTIRKTDFPTSEISEHTIIITSTADNPPRLITTTTPTDSPTTETFTDALEELDECRDLVALAPGNTRRNATRRRGRVFNLNRSSSGSGRMTLFPDGAEEAWQKELEEKMGTAGETEVKEVILEKLEESVEQEARQEVNGKAQGVGGELKLTGKEMEKKEVIYEDEVDEAEWEGYKRDTWGNGVIAL